ncbi:MAG: methylenetetrahydrofolate reductase, partial [Luminiphilus sp.]
MATEGNCSLEFFPPKTSAGLDKLVSSTLPALSALNPDYCSVTYGAG